MELLFATTNSNKIEEAKSIFPKNYKIHSLKDVNFTTAIEEPFETFKENAEQKATVVWEHFSKEKNVFAEDSGLEVESLNSLPGVKSARFAGIKSSAEENIQKLLSSMANKSNRNALFKATFCLYLKGKKYFFEGQIEGTISNRALGKNGFGYDSVFIPKGQKRTFAEMKLEEKNRYSHRKIALEKMFNNLLIKC